MDPHRQEGRLFGAVYTLLLVNNKMSSSAVMRYTIYIILIEACTFV